MILGMIMKVISYPFLCINENYVICFVFLLNQMMAEKLHPAICLRMSWLVIIRSPGFLPPWHSNLIHRLTNNTSITREVLQLQILRSAHVTVSEQLTCLRYYSLRSTALLIIV